MIVRRRRTLKRAVPILHSSRRLRSLSGRVGRTICCSGSCRSDIRRVRLRKHDLSRQHARSRSSRLRSSHARSGSRRWGQTFDLAEFTCGRIHGGFTTVERLLAKVLRMERRTQRSTRGGGVRRTRPLEGVAGDVRWPRSRVLRAPCASAFRSAARRRRAGCSGDGEDELSLGPDQQGSCAVSASGHASASAKPTIVDESSDECALAAPSSSRVRAALTVVRSRSAKCSSIAT